MLDLWIPLTIAGAFFQNLRSALQKHLKLRLNDAGATYVRFFYAWPLALIYCWSLSEFGGLAVPAANTQFLLYCLLGGISQIVFTFLLVWMFSFRNFAVGTTYSKTEVLQVAIFGFVLLGDTVTTLAAMAISLSLIGVMALSVAQTKMSVTNLFTSLTEKATLIGLASGVFMGASVVFYRGAALSLEAGSATMRAAFALAVSVVMQTVIMGIYLRVRDPGQLTAVVREWRWSLLVGIAGMLASICWFTALTLQNAAYVRALGQIELVFTFVASILFFKEKTKALEYAGIALIIAAILILVLWG